LLPAPPETRLEEGGFVLSEAKQRPTFEEQPASHLHLGWGVAERDPSCAPWDLPCCLPPGQVSVGWWQVARGVCWLQSGPYAFGSGRGGEAAPFLCLHPPPPWCPALCVSMFLFFLGFLDWRQNNFRIISLFGGEESRESERGVLDQTPPSVNPVCRLMQVLGGKPAGRGWLWGKNTWGWAPSLTPKSCVLGGVLRLLHLRTEGRVCRSWRPVLVLFVVL